MDDKSFEIMRNYITATDYLAESKPVAEEAIMETSVPIPLNVVILNDLKDIVFKLRAFTESEDGDVGLGIEMGMHRAADMIENLVKRHIEGLL